VLLEGMCKLKKKLNDLIGTGTRDHPVFSSVPTNTQTSIYYKLTSPVHGKSGMTYSRSKEFVLKTSALSELH
jgi:hypothetical protein